MAQLSLTCPGPGGGTTTSGITPAEHEIIDSLVHELSEDTESVLIRDIQGRITNYTVSSSATGKDIRTTEITRNAQGQVTQVTEHQHDVGGAIIQTLVTTITRSGGKVVSVTTNETELF